MRRRETGVRRVSALPAFNYEYTVTPNIGGHPCETTYLSVYEQQVPFLAGQGHKARSSRIVHVSGHLCSRVACLA